MNIEEIVNELLKKIPYSKKYQKVRNKIKESLNQEYEKEIFKNKTHLEAITEILKKYGTIEKAGLLAGYTKEEILSWKENDNILDHKTFKTIFIKEKLNILIFTISLILFITFIINACIYKSLINIFFIIIFLILGIIYLLKIKSHTKKEYTFSFKTYYEIQNIQDKYHKKIINSILFAISYLGITLIILNKSYYRYDEIISIILSNVIVYEILAICIIKNLLISKNLKEKIANNYEKKYKSFLIKMIIFTLIYWTIIIVISLFLYKYLVINLIIIASIIYILIYLITIFKGRKNIVNHNIIINKKRILLITLAIVCVSLYQIMKLDFWLLSSNAAFAEAIDIEKSKIEYNKETGVYTLITNKEEFKILQLTDIHLGGSNFTYLKDSYALYDIKMLIKYTEPDLVIVTGDLVFPVGLASMSFNNKTTIIEFASYMRNLGIPWVYAYGNHDTESVANLTENDVDSLLKYLSYDTSKNLLYPYIQPNITGRNNQILEIRDENRNLIETLFILDSNSYIEGKNKGYDYIHDDQVDWYESEIKKLSKKEGYTVPSMLFFHIPLQEYQTAYDLYTNGSGEVTYHYGKKAEKVCASKIHSKLFDKALELGSTKAMFCGHDHLNNFSVTYKGIRLTYGLSIDYLAYHGIDKLSDQRGGTLITIHKDSSFNIEPIKSMDANLKLWEKTKEGL